MSVALVASLLLGYFAVLFLISRLTAKDSSNDTFFRGNRESPWYLVAFGMIGASLSGVTFISIPGWVESQHFSYLQMVLGYTAGYLVIALILLPLYYSMHLTSIYSYLGDRFGEWGHKTGAGFFLLSRVIGASFRMYLVVQVLQLFIFDDLNIPFGVTTALSILLIWVYTFRGGIKTVVWTDTLQTLFMLLSLGITIYIIAQNMGLNVMFPSTDSTGNSQSSLFHVIADSDISKVFVFGNWRADNYFWKHFFSGMFITIAMTGLDQDMMQKNLTCRNLGEAKKNMLWFSLVLVIVNLFFLVLGASLFLYADAVGMSIPEKTDLLFPTIAKSHIGIFAGSIFLLGLIAAAYSSADSALTSLTTSFCVDFLDIENKHPDTAKRTRLFVHIAFSALLVTVILVFNEINNKSVISDLFKAAGYTYGPLLGLFSFGMFTKRKIPHEELILVVCLISPAICYFLNANAEEWMNGYKFGFELLILNGLLTFLGLLAISEISKYDESDILDS